eukprot:scaffold3199_cov165-Amphora_coffeaeformis.AAC.15
MPLHKNTNLANDERRKLVWTPNCPAPRRGLCKYEVELVGIRSYFILNYIRIFHAVAIANPAINKKEAEDWRCARERELNGGSVNSMNVELSVGNTLLGVDVGAFETISGVGGMVASGSGSLGAAVSVVVYRIFHNLSNA